MTGVMQARLGDSGAALVTDNMQAFTLRAITAREAGRSLDAMYYIWSADLTGNLLKYELLAAAERGVRVRLLIDDMNGPARDPLLLAMDTHPLFEVRLFNPTRNRSTSWRRAIEMVMRAVGFNRRMHNKAWIADNRLALVGGRNIGDEYFDAAPAMNFHDADLLLAGRAVDDASAIFDRFWNSSEVIPLRALHTRPAEPDKLPQWRTRLYTEAAASPWVQALGDPRELAERLRQDIRMHWTSSVRVLSDPPEKAAPVASHRARADWLLYDLMQLLFSARERTWLMSPYFVPGDPGVLLLTGKAARGKDVKVITNSLAANDVPVVHAGYKRQRVPLLSRGVRLYELRPSAANIEREILGSSGASLHTKAFVIDSQRGFVGSFNFDPRSAQLNTEMGVLFDHAPLASELEAIFVRASQPDNSWRLSLDEATGSLRWHEAEHIHIREPQASRWLLALVGLLSWLPIESQL